jgi:hypothetical protein
MPQRVEVDQVLTSDSSSSSTSSSTSSSSSSSLSLSAVRTMSGSELQREAAQSSKQAALALGKSVQVGATSFGDYLKSPQVCFVDVMRRALSTHIYGLTVLCFNYQAVQCECFALFASHNLLSIVQVELSVLWLASANVRVASQLWCIQAAQ